MQVRKKVILIIMDGWGHGKNAAASAIAQANTPNVDSYYSRFPNAELRTDGEFVGLPEGQMGNSEVGHLNIGAGRIVYQELQRIFVAIRSGELAKNAVLQQAIQHARDKGKNIHLIGLVSDGGVHSHIRHLTALCDIVRDSGFDTDRMFIHAFTDGRDTDPKSGIGFIRQLEDHLRTSGGRIASVVGRYYAMDRDKRWERIKSAYDLLVSGKGKKCTSAVDAIESSYKDGLTDEFILPVSITGADGQPVAVVEEGDVVISFNFRTDRCRQITRALTCEDFPEWGMQAIPLHFITMTRYDHAFEHVGVIFEKEDITQTLGEILEENNLQQLRMAETEKYPHVTFFFSGGREKEFRGEGRILINSPKVATYDLQPEMSAPALCEALLEAIPSRQYDFICINFANADMVGHTGVFEAAVKACETVDGCVGRIVESALANEYAIFLTADHGNSDLMVNPDGSPNTAHTTHPVPLFYIDNSGQYSRLSGGKLGDIAPTVLSVMGIQIPEAMSGNVLLN